MGGTITTLAPISPIEEEQRRAKEELYKFNQEKKDPKTSVKDFTNLRSSFSSPKELTFQFGATTTWGSYVAFTTKKKPNFEQFPSINNEKKLYNTDNSKVKNSLKNTQNDFDDEVTDEEIKKNIR